ncbi:glycogen debranching protein GlgX [Marinagarivorans cellulosilyticus]|uniref:Isoamylase n=1 Tax=Marinagarivorans cellulosilyticus TaxID=2721545 RepID=A0AAN1WEK5_9GAMM|nr:glycogen debranching protein GlgX [Marinagarivorans cellulosilyticus]BCD96161.1 isoamylase [Marinagarivorans cellulosilyticus]
MSKTADRYELELGKPYPLGATAASDGVNFAIFSAQAKKVELCLFSVDGKEELQRIELLDCTDHVWHTFLRGARAGLVYAYRIDGDYKPKEGLRFNANKLLVDPYAKSLVGEFVWSDAHYSYIPGDADADLSFSKLDNAAFMPKAVVVAPSAPPTPLAEPIAWEDTIIYETHVKGFTHLQRRLPPALRGKYLGFGHPDVISYLKDLGITSVEFLPVHGFIHDQFVEDKGLKNYWGYNSLNFFLPHGEYANDDAVAEFKQMVSALHEAGIEVLLDVVYNHTGEGNQLGPTYSFRGVDNASYYGLEADRRFYINDTGCGNTVNINNPRVLQLVMDSLRYWVTEMGVDGFRFDLASVLGREPHGFDPHSGFFDAVRQDPTLAGVKLIAEPWDIGPGGYQLGNYPAGWGEWNDKYRDVVRRFWRGDSGMLPDFAKRIHGSSDLFEAGGRRPSASVNFVASHDGFTTADLVSYNQRHNLANKEDNNDGHKGNFSHNHGVEGPTADAAIVEIRNRQKRNLLATSLLSQGTPMLLGGDELGRSQKGNNNAYCQDSEISWFNWAELTLDDWTLKNFVRQVIKLRQSVSLLRNPRYIHNPGEDEAQNLNIVWLNRDGEPMQECDWHEQDNHSLGWMLESTEPVHECVLTLFNADSRKQSFGLPKGWEWELKLDTSKPNGQPHTLMASVDSVTLEDKSLMVFIGVDNSLV